MKIKEINRDEKKLIKIKTRENKWKREATPTINLYDILVSISCIKLSY